jgi:hypothetical protein
MPHPTWKYLVHWWGLSLVSDLSQTYSNTSLLLENSKVDPIVAIVRNIAERLDTSALIALSIALEQKVEYILRKQLMD